MRAHLVPMATNASQPADAAHVRAPATANGARSLWARAAGGVAVMVVLTTVASATNYASTLVFSRLLEPARFGDLTALLALSVVLAVPAGAAQTLIAERVAVLAAEGRTHELRYLIRHAFAHVQTLALVGGCVYALAIPIVTASLDLEGPGPAVALLPLLVSSFLIPVAFGILQGLDRFVALGVVTVLSAGSRIALGVPFVAVTGGAGGVLAAQAVGNILTLLLVGWLLREHLLRAGTGAATAGIRRRVDLTTLYAGAAFVAFALLSNLDVVLAKLFLSREESGHYAALSTLAKVILFLPAAVAVVMVPNAARARRSTGSSTRVLRVAAALVVATALGVALPAALVPEFVLTLMFGPAYAGAAPGVVPIVASGTGLALLYLIVVYSVAIRDRAWVRVLLAGVVAQAGGIALFHDSAVEVATAQAVAVAFVLVVNEVWFHSLVWRGRRAAAP